MDDIARLVAIETIKQLKARYFQLVDSKQWDAWRSEVWTREAELTLPSIRPEPYVGADAICELARTALASVITIHQGHMPIITILAPHHASGVWAMEERHYASLDAITPCYHGWGYYHEDYVWTEKGWRIARSILTRTHPSVPIAL